MKDKKPVKAKQSLEIKLAARNPVENIVSSDIHLLLLWENQPTDSVY